MHAGLATEHAIAAAAISPLCGGVSVEQTVHDRVPRVAVSSSP